MDLRQMLVFVALSTLVLVACDRTSETVDGDPDLAAHDETAISDHTFEDRDPAEGEASKNSNNEAFTWRDLLELKPERIHEVLGAPDCDRTQRLPTAAPEHIQVGRSMWLYACDYASAEPLNSHADYAIERIRWSENTPAYLRLVPKRAISMDEAPQVFSLPDRPHEYNAYHDDEGTFVSIRSYEFDGTVEGALAVSIVGELDDHSRVKHVDIYRNVWVTWSRARPFSKFLTRHDVLAPATTSILTPGYDQVFVTLDENEVAYRIVRRKGNFEPLDFETVDRTETPRLEILEHAWEKLDSQMTATGRTAMPDAAVLPSAAYDAGDFDTFARHAAAADVRFLEMLGRSVPAPSETVKRFVQPGSWTLRLESPEDVGKSPLVLVRKDGIDLKISGKKVEPVEGCSKNGPTLCLKGKGSSKDAMKEVRRRASSGDLVMAEEKLREVVEAYDWSGVYAQLVTTKHERGRFGPLYVKIDAGVPIAVLYRLADMARYMLAKPGGGCLWTATEDDLATLKPCRMSDEAASWDTRIFTLYESVAWVVEP